MKYPGDGETRALEAIHSAVSSAIWLDGPHCGYHWVGIPEPAFRELLEVMKMGEKASKRESEPVSAGGEG